MHSDIPPSCPVVAVGNLPATAAFTEGAVLGNDMSGFRDPGYLQAAAAAGAAVGATHIRRRPVSRIPPRL
jgi:dihydropteroate synthase